MITTQRNYELNSKVIESADEDAAEADPASLETS